MQSLRAVTAALFLCVNIMKNEENNLIKISNDEMRYLREKGFKFPDDLHKTYSGSKNNRYYATESKPLLRILDQYRASKIVG